MSDGNKIKLKENDTNTDRIKLNDRLNTNKENELNQNNNFIYKNKQESELKSKEKIPLITPFNKNENVYKYYLDKKSISFYKISEEERIQFLFERFKNNQTLKCNILIRSGNLYVYTSNTQHFIFSAHKIKNKLRGNYIITSDYEGKNKIAQINSSLFKNEYIMYDDGISPKINMNKKDSLNYNLRRYLLEVKKTNENNFLKGYIFMPEVNFEINQFFNKDKEKKDKLSKLKKGIRIFQTEEPSYDIIKKVYINKYSSRVKISSNRNFRLIFEDNKMKKIILECGKVNDNIFIMDFSTPLSPLEAFGISISYLT